MAAKRTVPQEELTRKQRQGCSLNAEEDGTKSDSELHDWQAYRQFRRPPWQRMVDRRPGAPGFAVFEAWDVASNPHSVDSVVTYDALSDSMRPNPHQFRQRLTMPWMWAVSLANAARIPARYSGKPGTSMISKSQEETEISWRLEEWALEAGEGRISWRTACDPG